MLRYQVHIPIAGEVIVEVDASSREDAIRKALDCQLSEGEVLSLELYEKLVHNNVFYGPINRVYAYEVRDDEPIAFV